MRTGIRMWHGDDLKPIDLREVLGIAGVQRELVRYGHSRDHGIVRAYRWFTPNTGNLGYDPLV